MNERDEDGYEPETESFADPITERVRIIGAEPVGTAPVVESRPPATTGAAAYPDDGADPITSLDTGSSAKSGSSVRESDRWATPGGGEITSNPAVPRWLDDGDDDMDEPRLSTELPHWTDPPTGQVPAVLDRRSENDDDPGTWSAAGDAGPAWREHRHEWDDSGFDPSLLADETTRVGAMEELPLEERQPWEFDDLGPPTRRHRPPGSMARVDGRRPVARFLDGSRDRVGLGPERRDPAPGGRRGPPRDPGSAGSPRGQRGPLHQLVATAGIS